MTDTEVLRFVAGGLDEADTERTRQHTAGCEDCALLVAEASRETVAPEAISSGRLRPPMLAPGAVIAERYVIRRSLGMGAMGEVHEAEDLLLGKVVALKTLNAVLVDNPIAVRRLKSEVATAHRVTHPNVCRIFDLGTDESFAESAGAPCFFLTMEYLPGETLSALVRRHGRLSPEKALPLLVQMAAGLAAAHAVGVIHRDLKGENVMLVDEADGRVRVVITDFGLAGTVMRDTSTSLASRGFFGTLAYAAPERLVGKRATPASDVYSFGLLAHEMLTGSLPLNASSALLAAARRSGVTVGPLVGTPATGPAWDGFIMRTLHPDPGQRYQDGAALAAALEQLAAKPRARRFTRGTVPRAASLVLAFSAVLAAAGWSVSRAHRSNELVQTAVVATPPNAPPASMSAPANDAPAADREPPRFLLPPAAAGTGMHKHRAHPAPHSAPEVEVAGGVPAAEPPPPFPRPAIPVSATSDDIVREWPPGARRAPPVGGRSSDLIDPYRSESGGEGPRGPQ